MLAERCDGVGAKAGGLDVMTLREMNFHTVSHHPYPIKMVNRPFSYPKSNEHTSPHVEFYPCLATSITVN